MASYRLWVQARTITSSLPAEYQIGLAALWSLVLGLSLEKAVTRRYTPQASTGPVPC